ncbi:MAG: DUF981 family protein [Thermoprotei archaeon]
MIDPLAGMLWLTAASAVLVAVFFIRSEVFGAKAPGAEKAVRMGAGSGVTQTLGSKEVTREVENRSLGSLAVGVGVLGAFTLIMGVWMDTTWPLVSSYNILFGEIYVGFGLVLLMGSISYILGYDLKAASYVGAILGLWGLTDAYGILINGMTSEPTIAAAMYIFGGIAGLLSPLAVHKPSKATAAAFALFLVLFALVAWFIGFEASIAHLRAFAKYTP